MRKIEIISMIGSNLSLGILIFLGLVLIFSLGYFIVYRKILGGRKRLKARDLIWPSLLIIYILMVVAATLIDRGGTGSRQVNLHLFSSYRQAWNQWSLRNWQYQVLNILMFLPLGILLPLALPRTRDLKKVFLFSLGLSLFIESSQLITARGIFELDDLFNNVLGGLLGYSIYSGLDQVLGQGKLGRGLACFLPLGGIVLGFFLGLNTYRTKELGNLYIDPNYRYNMKGVELVNRLDLDDQEEEGRLYRVGGYTREEAQALAESIFTARSIQLDEVQLIDYEEDSIYKGGAYSIWINKSQGIYNIRDFNQEAGDLSPLSQEEAYGKLEEYGLDYPQGMEYRSEARGALLVADSLDQGDRILEGELSLEASQGEIVRIENNIVAYSSYSQEKLRSQKEAWEDIKRGDFNYYRDGVKRIELLEIQEDYLLDSKGFYQPVYRMRLRLDQEPGDILIRRLGDR